MNQNPEQLRRNLLETNFQLSLHIVHTGERQVIRKRAVTGNIGATAYSLKFDLMHIQHFGKLGHDCLEFLFQLGVAQDFVAGFDSRRLAFDVGENRGNFRYFLANLGFQPSDPVVGFFHG